MTETPDAAAPVERAGWLRRNAALIWAGGLVLIGVVVSVLGSGLAPIAIGHLGYAPLAATILFDGPPFWLEPFFIGLVIALAGLLILAASLGYRAGVKRAQLARPSVTASRAQ